MALQMYNNQPPCFDRAMQDNRRIQTWLKVKHLLNTQFSYNIDKDHQARNQSDQELLETNKKQLMTAFGDIDINMLLSCFVRNGNTQQLINIYNVLKTIKVNNKSQKPNPITNHNTMWQCLLCDVQNEHNLSFCKQCNIHKQQNQDLFTKKEMIEKEKEWNILDPEWKTAWPLNRCCDILRNNAPNWQQSYAKMYIKYHRSIKYWRMNNNKLYRGFSLLSSIEIRIICSFLPKSDIVHFKGCNTKISVTCLQEMTKINVGVYLMNLSVEKYISFYRYAPNTSFSTLSEEWERLYHIKTNRQIISHYNPSNQEHTLLTDKAIANKAISSTKTCDYLFDLECKWIKPQDVNRGIDAIKLYGPYLLFDAQNVTILTPYKADRMDRYNPIRSDNKMDLDQGYIPNYSLLTLKYYDVMEKRLDIIDFICISKDVTFSRLFDYIENEYILNTKKWYNTFKNYVNQINNDGGMNRKYSVLFERRINENGMDYDDCVAGLNERSPVNVVPYLSALDDEFVKQTVVFRFKSIPKYSSLTHNTNNKMKEKSLTPKRIQKQQTKYREQQKTMTKGHDKGIRKEIQIKIEPKDPLHSTKGNTNNTKSIQRETTNNNSTQSEGLLRKVIERESGTNKVIVHFKLSQDQAKNPSFLGKVLTQIEGLNSDHRSVRQFIDKALKDHSFHCGASRKMGILRNQLAAALNIAGNGKYIEVYLRGINNNMQRKSWVHDVDKQVYYEWRLVGYDTRIWNEDDRIYRLKLFVPDSSQPIQRHPKEIDFPLFIRHKKRFKVKELIRLMNQEMSQYHSLNTNININHIIITSLSRCYGSNQIYTNTSSKDIVTDLNVYIVPNNCIDSIDNETQFILHIRMFDGHPKTGSIKGGKTTYKDAVDRLVGIPFMIKFNKEDNLQTVIDSTSFNTWLKDHIACCYRLNGVDSKLKNVQKRSKSYKHIKCMNIINDDLNEILIIKLNKTLGDYNSTFDILRDITNLDRNKSNNNNNNNKTRYSLMRGQKVNDEPPLHGQTEIPKGKPYCLLGKRFVITGQLPSLTRDECKEVIKTYGGRVTTGISGMTKYLIKGDDAGHSKIQKAKKNNVSIVTEAQFLNLLRTLPSNDPQNVSPSKPKKATRKSKRISLKRSKTSVPLNSNTTEQSKPSVAPSSTEPNRTQPIKTETIFFIVKGPDGSIHIKFHMQQRFEDTKVFLEAKLGRRLCFYFNQTRIDNLTPTELVLKYNAKNNDIINIVYQ